MLYNEIDDYIKSLRDRVNAEMARRNAPYGSMAGLGNESFSKDLGENDVIEAASSKWNFIKLKPGLVGGHCISVDPYYLIQKGIKP